VLRIRLVIFFIKYYGLFFSFFFLRLRNQSIYCKDIPRVLYLKWDKFLKTGKHEIVFKTRALNPCKKSLDPDSSSVFGSGYKVLKMLQNPDTPDPDSQPWLKVLHKYISACLVAFYF